MLDWPLIDVLWWGTIAAHEREEAAAMAAGWTSLAVLDPETYAREFSSLRAVEDDRTGAELVASTLEAARRGWR